MLISGPGYGLSFEIFIPSRPSQTCKNLRRNDQEDPFENPRQVDMDAGPLDKILNLVESSDNLAEQVSMYTSCLDHRLSGREMVTDNPEVFKLPT